MCVVWLMIGAIMGKEAVGLEFEERMVENENDKTRFARH